MDDFAVSRDALYKFQSSQKLRFLSWLSSERVLVAKLRRIQLDGELQPTPQPTSETNNPDKTYFQSPSSRLPLSPSLHSLRCCCQDGKGIVTLDATHLERGGKPHGWERLHGKVEMEKWKIESDEGYGKGLLQLWNGPNIG